VLDDEEQFIGVLRPAHRVLRGQQPVEVEVSAVVHGRPEVGPDPRFDRAFTSLQRHSVSP
jgi:hypothetical protein